MKCCCRAELRQFTIQTVHNMQVPTITILHDKDWVDAFLIMAKFVRVTLSTSLTLNGVRLKMKATLVYVAFHFVLDISQNGLIHDFNKVTSKNP